MAEKSTISQMAQPHTQSRGLPYAMTHGTSDHEDLAAIPQSGFPKWHAGTIANLLVGAGPIRRVLIRANWALQDRFGSLAVLARQERDSGSMFGFAPVALGAGVALYFVAPSEPVFAIVFSSFLFAATMAARMKVHGMLYLVAITSALIFFGMTMAQIRTKLSGGPVIARQVTAAIDGIVIERDLNSRGNPRYLIEPGSIEGLKVEQLPKLIRLSASAAHASLEPGQPTSGIARISGFSGPAYQGGFDFGFSNWFDGLGGTGFFLGAPKDGTEAIRARISLRSKIRIAINAMRLAIGTRIRQRLDGESAAIAVAIIIGDRTGISGRTQESLRRSGLAHILAISGLHMALVTLTVIWTLRLSFSLSPKITLHYPTHKWAAFGGLVASTLYLFLSGGAVATQRSWIMLAIMLGATLIDRKALTIRNVALAAMIVLIVAPESLIEPGFQMSFAAAGALVAAYSGISTWRMARMSRREQRRGGNIATKAMGYFAGLAFTSIVAGLATGLFAAWHFHRVAPLGLVANLLAMPVVSVLVMPLALLSTLLMPYGIESIALRPLQWSIERVISISAWVNGIPAPSITGIQPIGVLLAGVLGILLLILLRTRLRFAGIVPIAAMFFLAKTETPPDLIVSQDGRAIGIRNSANELALVYPHRNRFVTDIWLRAWSNGRKGKLDDPAGPCDKDHCILATPSGIRVELVYAPEKIPSACETADILIAPRLWWINCPGHSNTNRLANARTRTPAVILKRLDFEKFGTHQLRFEELQVAASSGSSGPCSAGLPRNSSPGGQNELLLANWQNKCWRVSIEKSLSNDDRPWNAARIALVEPVFDRSRKVSGNR